MMMKLTVCNIHSFDVVQYILYSYVYCAGIDAAHFKNKRTKSACNKSVQMVDLIFGYFIICINYNEKCSYTLLASLLTSKTVNFYLNCTIQCRPLYLINHIVYSLALHSNFSK